MDKSTLAQFLLQRGHEIVSEGSSKDIFVPNSDDQNVVNGFEDILFKLMQSDTFRRNFRDWAYGNTISDEYGELIQSYTILGSSFDKNFPEIENSLNSKIQKYSHTFEWYISELMKREFGAKAAGFNIRLRDADPDDDFDCIAFIDNGLVFIECKTGKTEIYPEIAKFIRRDAELSGTHSFFIFDRDYTFNKGKEDIPDIKKSKALKLGIDSLEKITVGRSGFYLIACDNRCFLASPGYKGLKTRMRHMLRYTTMFSEGGGMHRKAYEHQIMEFAPDPLKTQNKTTK